MDLKTVPNPLRGCGELKEKAFYARGDMGSGGALGAWTWCLGEGVIGGRNLTLAPPSRITSVIRLPETLLARRITKDKGAFEFPVPLDGLPAFALLDHVGSEHYSPISFAYEAGQHGPSRRLNEAFARQIARFTPMPILFTHSDMPLVDVAYSERLLRWATNRRLADFAFGCTYDYPEWGIYSKSKDDGCDHWLIPVLQAMNKRGGTPRLSEFMPAELAEQTLLEEQAFGISWITRIVYVADGTEGESRLEDLLADGIEPVVKEDLDAEN